MVSIYDYFDYRKFLHDIYREHKTANPLFSYRYIGGKVGFSSAGFFSKILKGTANISMKSAIAFARLFKLTKQETHYFEVLVQFNQAKTHESKKYFFEQLLSMKQTGGKNLVPEQYELFNTWYHVVIRELLNYYPFYGDYKELASMLVPAIRESEAKKAIAVLEKLGLIIKGPDGSYEQTDAVISTGETWSSIAIEQFQIAMADLAGQTIRKTPKEQRDISTCTWTLAGLQGEKINVILPMTGFGGEALMVGSDMGIRWYQSAFVPPFLLQAAVCGCTA